MKRKKTELKKKKSDLILENQNLQIFQNLIL